MGRSASAGDDFSDYFRAVFGGAFGEAFGEAFGGAFGEALPQTWAPTAPARRRRRQAGDSVEPGVESGQRIDAVAVPLCMDAGILYRALSSPSALLYCFCIQYMRR